MSSKLLIDNWTLGSSQNKLKEVGSVVWKLKEVEEISKSFNIPLGGVSEGSNREKW